jgi:glutathione S-transferase
MLRPQLFGTPLSHFTRKVRVLFAELGIDYDFVRAPGVLGHEPSVFGGNPLLRVPALRIDGETIIESDHIARHLVTRFDRADRLGVKSERVADLNRLAVVNGIMDNEVVLILAKRGGLTDLENVVYFRKLASAIESGLGWLDANLDADDRAFDYGDIAAICMWQHVSHYQLVAGLDRFPRVAARVARFADRRSIVTTAPEYSLAEAVAAGWKPT